MGKMVLFALRQYIKAFYKSKSSLSHGEMSVVEGEGGELKGDLIQT